ncbi:hypothetical protein CYMTET_18856 [Cymbomonas tetramitiformis]|uniref:ATP-dependent DNA helicase n=1 Tax=Cymbomonas tetramitiformis TaxID=36881 RepID=A0AAE0L5U2_9CHLO|nr:hypothetical protein CYMTET_18856 [Cymbomonas tetramitiformis]
MLGADWHGPAKLFCLRHDSLIRFATGGMEKRKFFSFSDWARPKAAPTKAQRANGDGARRQRGSTCYKCGGLNHWASNCTGSGAAGGCGAGGGRPAPGAAPAPSRGTSCYKCGQQGHWASSCGVTVPGGPASEAPPPRAEPAEVAAQERAPVSLNMEQKRGLRSILQGRTVFLTGPAGTGKSVLLREAIAQLQRAGKRVAVTAPTGIAAEAVGGTTIHAFAGCGVPQKWKDFGRMWDHKAAQRWRTTDVLVIEEVSMLSGELLDGIEGTVGAIRTGAGVGTSIPFGGLQIIFCGDFFQLPPIFDATSKGGRETENAFRQTRFAFESDAWQALQPVPIVLQQVQRQADAVFAAALNSVRRGVVNGATRTMLSRCQRSLTTLNGIKPTELFSLNAQVDRVNRLELQKLHEAPCALPSVDAIHPEAQDKVRQLENHSFWKNCKAAKFLELKTGAQVMLLKNLDLESSAKLVNGSRGVVSGWESCATVMKDLQRSLQSRQEAKAGGPEAEKVERLKRFMAEGNEWLPRVLFANNREMVLSPEQFSASVSSAGTCTRVQVPLMLAWAITIHKAQGMSLDCVRMSLGSAFAPGQVYVALSRARSVEGLEISEIDYSKITVEPRVASFIDSIDQHEPEHCIKKDDFIDIGENFAAEGQTSLPVRTSDIPTGAVVAMKNPEPDFVDLT